MTQGQCRHVTATRLEQCCYLAWAWAFGQIDELRTIFDFYLLFIYGSQNDRTDAGGSVLDKTTDHFHELDVKIWCSAPLIPIMGDL